MRGTISEGVLPGLLRELYVGRKTGDLRFTRGEEQRSVRVRRGNIVHASTNVRADHLGELLVRLGRLTEADLARATERVIRDKKRLGTVLLETGLLDGQGLDEVLGLHVRESLLKVFGWSDGEYAFEEQDADSPGIGEELTLSLSTGEMILEAVRRVADPDVVRYALGDTDRILGLSMDPLLRFQKITLTPVDGFILSRVDGSLAAREVVALAPVATEEAERSLFGLLCTGTVEYLPLPPKPRPKRWRTMRMPRPAEVPSPPQAVAAAPPPPDPAVPGPGADAKTQERRKEIVELHAGLKAKNHFEILGLPRGSSEAEIKAAYFKLARRFHPDTQHDPALADLAEQIEAIFISLGAAYETLRNPRTRASYEERLGSYRPAPAPVLNPTAPAPSTPAASGPAAPGESPTDPRLVEEALRRAGKLYEQEKYWDAIQLLEPQAAQAAGRQGARVLVLLARCYLKNPRWGKRAEEELQKAVKADSGNAEGYFLLGGLYKSSGLRNRAASMFRRALEIKPDYREAASELEALIPTEPTPGKTEAGGLLKKLFRKE